jgi:hypothetical protein
MTARIHNQNLQVTTTFAALVRWSLVLAIVITAFAGLSATASAATLFSENFEGYTSFPVEIPDNDPVNPGLPVWWEGAKETWYGARFLTPSDNSSIDSDLAVQKWGGGTNNSHTGRVSDNAGMLFHISTVGYESVLLNYEWRTFLAEGSSRMRVGYYVGSLAGHLEVGLIPDFANFNTEFGSSFWTDEWVQTTSGQSNSWQSKQVSLPGGQADIWVAFWLKGSNCEYGKLDNICVTGNQVVPEPSSIVIALMGCALCGVVAVRRRVAARRSGIAR